MPPKGKKNAVADPRAAFMDQWVVKRKRTQDDESAESGQRSGKIIAPRESDERDEKPVPLTII